MSRPLLGWEPSSLADARFAALAAACAGALGAGVVAAARLRWGCVQGWGLDELWTALTLEAGAVLCLTAVPLAIVAWRRASTWAMVVVVSAAIGLELAATAWIPVESGARPAGVAPGGHTLVLVTLDTLRRDHVSAYDDAVVPGLTPRLEALASVGTTFEQAVTTAPLTLPSHVTLLTGVHPADHGVVRNGHAVPPEVDAVPAALGRQGWRTGAFVSSLVLHGSLGMRQWFEVYRDDHTAIPGMVYLPFLRLGVSVWRRLAGHGPDRLGKERGERTVGRALHWLGTLRADESVFLWVHLYDAHMPYQTAALPHGGAWGAIPHPCAFADHPSALRRAGRRPLFQARPPLAAADACEQGDWSETRRAVGRYAAEVAYVDAQVGALLDGLDGLGRGDAHVVVVADHGESLTEHQQLSAHQYSLYEPVVRVPLVIRSPRLCRGCRVDHQVSTAQVADMLSWLAAGTGDGPLDTPAHPAVAVGPAGWSGRVDEPRDTLQAMVREPGRKAIVVEWGHTERYDLGADPHEERPLVEPADTRALEAVVSERLDPPTTGGPLRMALGPRGLPERVRAALAQPGLRGTPLAQVEAAPPFDDLEQQGRQLLEHIVPTGAEGTDPAVRDALEALGYLQ